MNPTIKKVAYCPHCGNRAPQRLIHKQNYLERVWSSADGAEAEPAPWSIFIAVCETCNHALLYENVGDQFDEDKFDICELVYPSAAGFPVSVPQQIKNVYDEANRIKRLAPNAFAVQIRRAMEVLCEDKGVTTGSLQKRLDKLVDKGEIPPVLAEATDLLRLLGNVGAHGTNQTVHPLLANAIDEFFRAVVEYVYVAPSKLKEFRDTMNRYLKKNRY